MSVLIKRDNSTSKRSKRVVKKINSLQIFLAYRSCVRQSITSNSSLSLEAKWLNFCILTPYINVKKGTIQTFEV